VKTPLAQHSVFLYQLESVLLDSAQCQVEGFRALSVGGPSTDSGFDTANADCTQVWGIDSEYRLQSFPSAWFVLSECVF